MGNGQREVLAFMAPSARLKALFCRFAVYFQPIKPKTGIFAP
jgi:hypothetical protein